MSRERQSWTQRRAAQVDALPRAPKRPLERPTHAQPVALADDHPQSHRWIVNAAIPVTSAIARTADFRGMFRAAAGLKIEALDVLCSECGKPFGDVAGGPCEVSQTASSGIRDHLLGGRLHERARRTVSPEADRELVRDRAKKAGARAANRESLSRAGNNRATA